VIIPQLTDGAVTTARILRRTPAVLLADKLPALAKIVFALLSMLTHILGLP
jgi:hypothetical protein